MAGDAPLPRILRRVQRPDSHHQGRPAKRREVVFGNSKKTVTFFPPEVGFVRQVYDLRRDGLPRLHVLRLGRPRSVPLQVQNTGIDFGMPLLVGQRSDVTTVFLSI